VTRNKKQNQDRAEESKGNEPRPAARRRASAPRAPGATRTPRAPRKPRTRPAPPAEVSAEPIPAEPAADESIPAEPAAEVSAEPIPAEPAAEVSAEPIPAEPASHTPSPPPVETPVAAWMPAPPPPVETPVATWMPPLPPAPARALDEPREEPQALAGAGMPSPATRWLFAADIGSLAVIGGLMFLNLAGTGGPLRLVLALLFVTGVPGWALVRAAGLSGGWSSVAIAVLASLTICAASSTVLVWAGAWHPLVLFAVLAAGSAIVILWTLPPTFVAVQQNR
jgi:hypothetical protein